MTLALKAARSRGFALMMAIFMIVTLAAIAVYLVTISTGQIEAATQDEQSTRAYQAARTGVDWAAFQLLRNPTSGFSTGCAGGASSQTLTLTLGLNGFYAEVACTKVGSEAEGAVTLQIYRVTVTGCNSSPCGTVAPTYVERQLQLTLTQ